MSAATTEAVQTETVEVVKVHLLATRSTINPTAPEGNKYFSSMNIKGDLNIIVTQNAEGRIRAAVCAGKSGYKIGDKFTAKKYGELTVVGQVTKAGRKSGLVPDEKLPMRVFSTKA